MRNSFHNIYIMRGCIFCMFDSDDRLELIEAARTAVNNADATSDARVEARQCKSDAHDTGIELTFTGDSIAIRKILEEIEKTENWAVENIFYSIQDDYFNCRHCDEKIRETGVSLFCVYNPTETNTTISLA